MKHQNVIKRKRKRQDYQNIMYKYAQLKRFHHDGRTQVFIYAVKYVDPDTMTTKDHFPATKAFVVNYKKIPTPGPVPKQWRVFSSIRSYYYELDKKLMIQN